MFPGTFSENGVALCETVLSRPADDCSTLRQWRLLLNAAGIFCTAGVIMKRKLINGQAATYTLAGIFFTMLVTFVVYDLDAVRRESGTQGEDRCSAVALRACPSRAASTIHGVQGLLIASAE